MRNKVAETISTFSMLSAGERVLVGLSGGADSVALLLVLRELGYDVSACHINHQLRGDESDSDERFCADLCKRLDIKLTIRRLDVKGFCQDKKLGTEEGARILRYQVFDEVSDGIKIATAHTLSDVMETFLFNFARGTSLPGLCSIPPVRDNIIRPLIQCTRQEVEDYLSLLGQSFVTDSTNLSTDYSRNRIRHEVIPQLRVINPSLEKSFINTILSLRCENDFLEKTAESILKEITLCDNELDAQLLCSKPRAVAQRVVAKLLKDKGLQCSYEKITSILNIALDGGKYNISNDVYAISQKGKLKICSLEKQKSFTFESFLEVGKTYDFDKKKIHTEIANANQKGNINSLFTITCLDYDKIQGKAVLRNRREGDRIKFLNKQHTQSVKKLFNKDVELSQRDKIAFICDDNGVIFIEGYGAAQRVAADEGTKNLLIITITEGNV